METLSSRAVAAVEGPRQWYRSHLLPWFGIIGAAITIYGNIGAVLDLSDWISWVIQHWHYYTHRFWQFLASLIGLQLAPPVSAALNATVFVAAILASAYRETDPILLKSELKVVSSDVWYKHYQFCLALILLFFPFGIYYTYNSYKRRKIYYKISFEKKGTEFPKYMTMLFVFIFFLPVIPFDALEKDSVRPYAIGTFCLAGVGTSLASRYISTRVLAKRLVFVWVGVILLFGMAFLSTLDLDIQAPKTS